MTKAIFKKNYSDYSSEVEELTPLLQDNKYNKHRVSKQINIIKKGLKGEKELGYFLSNTFEEIFCLHNVFIQNGKQKSQLDYVILTRNCIWILESKSLSGNLTVLKDGQLIREKGSCERYPLVQANIQMENLKEYLLSKNLVNEDIEIKYRVVFTDTDSKVNVTYEIDEIKENFINVELISSVFKNTSSLKENLTLNQIDEISKDLIEETEKNKIKFKKKVYPNYYLNKKKPTKKSKNKLLEFLYRLFS